MSLFFLLSACIQPVRAQHVPDTSAGRSEQPTVENGTSRLYYSLAAPAVPGSKAGGKISSEQLKNGEVYCIFETGTQVKIWLENASDVCQWSAMPADKVEFFGFTGPFSDTVMLRFKVSSAERTDITFSVTEGQLAQPSILAIVIPRQARQASAIVVSGLLNDTTYCEDLLYSVSVAEDPDYTAEKNGYGDEYHRNANLEYDWVIAERATGSSPIVSRGYNTDPTEMYRWEASVPGHAKYWVVQPRTCEESRLATDPTSRAIQNIIPKSLTDEPLSIRAIRRIENPDAPGEYIWDDEENEDYKNACVWYSEDFNRDNAVEKSLHAEEIENGYICLQAMPYKPDDISFRYYSYVWNYDPDKLEPALDKMNTPAYAEAGFGSNRGRICFKVKDDPDAADKNISVSYKMVCEDCNERANRQGLSYVYESAPSASILLHRVDSLVDAKVEYTPSIRDEQGSTIKPIDNELLRLCGKAVYDLCNTTENASDISGFEWKALDGEAWESADEMNPGGPSANPGTHCNRYRTPSIRDEDGHQGDTVRLLTYPRNACFQNGNDSNRNARVLRVYVRSVPQAPVLIDTIDKTVYTGRELETDYNNQIVWPYEGLDHPLLLCNNSGFGLHSLGANQSFLLYTANNSFKAEDYEKNPNLKSGYGVVFPGMNDPNAAAALQNAYSFAPYNGKEYSDTNILVFRINLNDRAVLAGKTQIPFGIYAANECGAGDPVYFAINIIDTLSVAGHIQDMDRQDSDYDTVSLCEGVMVQVTNASANHPGFVSGPADAKRNTDKIQYQWKIPSSWRFNTSNGSERSPQTEVWIGQEKGSVKLALRNRCGIGKYRSGDSINVNPYTRTTVKVVDGLLSNSPAYDPKDPANQSVFENKPDLLRPCQGAFIMYAADTCERTDRYRWEFPRDWQVITAEVGYNGTAEADPANPFWAYTENGSLNSLSHDMRVKVRVGADTGYIYVVGAKAECGFTFDNYLPDFTVDPPHYGHRRDSLEVKIKPFTSKPAQAFRWEDSLCARTPVTLIVKPDPAQDSMTRANTDFSWRFPADYGTVDYTAETPEATGKKTTVTFTVPDRAGSYDTIVVFSHRKDCDLYNESDSLVYIYKISDTLSFAAASYISDLKRPREKLNTTPCEGDTVFYVVRPDTKRYLDSVVWTWNGGQNLYAPENTPETESARLDTTGWQVLNRPGHYADTLKLVVGRAPIRIGAQAASRCGLSDTLAVDIRPIGLVRETAHLVQGRTLLCEGEKIVFEWDSVPHATAYRWYFPWGAKEDSLTIDRKMYYREFGRKTVYDTGSVYVRPVNRCGAGPYSDTVKIATIVGALGRPEVRAIDPIFDYTPLNDTIYDTVCLRTKRTYEARFEDESYPDAEWVYRWIDFSLRDQDSLYVKTEDPVLADSSQAVFVNRNASGTKFFGVVVRHAQCLTFGDTLTLRVRPADTIGLTDAELADCLFDLHAGGAIQSKPCGNDTAMWRFDLGKINDTASYRFVWWTDERPDRAREWNPADSTLAGTGFKWLNPTQDDAAEDYKNDTLQMRVGNGQTLHISVDLKNRCGISRLPGIKINTVVSIADSLYKLQREPGLICDREDLIFRVDSSANIGGYIWHYPWGLQTDTVKVGTQVRRVFRNVSYDTGYVYVTPYNGCGLAKTSDSVRIEDICRIPSRAVPANFAYSYEADKNMPAVDSLCMRTAQVLNVNFGERAEELEYETHWQLLKGNKTGFDPAADSCRIEQESLAQEAFVIEVSSRVKGCKRYSDTLEIRIFPMDTLVFVETVVEDEDLAPFEVLLPTVAVNRADMTSPIDLRPCGNTEQQYSIHSDIHWSVPADSQPYYLWSRPGGEIMTEPEQDLSLGGTDWHYKGELFPAGRFYRNLPLTTGLKDTLQLYIRVANRCGSSQSPALTLIPQPAVTEAPRIAASPLCMGEAVSFDCEPVENATRYHWSFPWEPFRDSSENPSVNVPRVSGEDGPVIVYASNDCGFGPSDTLHAAVLQTPKRPLPAWKPGADETAYVRDADTVVEKLCLHGESQLRVTRDPADGAALKYHWSLLGEADMELLFADEDRPANDSVCTIRATPAAGRETEAVFMIWGVYPECGGTGDTLFIRVSLTDTVAVADLGKIDISPADLAVSPEPCPESEIELRVQNDVAPAYKWMLPETWKFKADIDTTAASVVVVTGTARGSIGVAPLTDPSAVGCGYFSSDPVRTPEFVPRPTPETEDFTADFLEYPCVGSVVTYSVQASIASNIKAYRWEFPDNWEVIEDDALVVPTLNSACRVLVGTDSGSVKVYALDSCDDRLIQGSLREKEVFPVDTARLRVLGDHNVCLDSLLVLTVEALNAYTSAGSYDLKIEYRGEDATPVAISFPDPADSTYMEVRCSNRDTVALVFTPKNRYCPQNAEPFIHYIIADTIPEIPGTITGPAFVCADNEYAFAFHLDRAKNADSLVSYTWRVPHAGWRILSGENDTIVTMYFDSLPSDPQTGLPLRQTDTIACYPRGSCGTALPALFVVQIQPQDPFEDKILVDPERPCIGTDVRIRLQGTYNPDTIRFVWDMPDAWVRHDNDSLPQTSCRVQYEPVSHISVRYRRDGGCGWSEALHRSVYVRDSASKAALDGLSYLCYTREVYEAAVAPDSTIDRIEWLLAPEFSFRTYTREGSAIENDSVAIDNAAYYRNPISMRVRSFNSCGSRDTILLIVPVLGTTAFTDYIHVPRFCLSDTGHAYIRIPEGQRRDGTQYRWLLGDTAYRPIEEFLAGDTVAGLRFVAGAHTEKISIVLKAGNDCADLPEERVDDIRPFTYVITAEADPVRVPYGTEGVKLEVTGTGAGPVENFTFAWGPENRLLPGEPGLSYRQTGRLVQAEETFYVSSRQKMLQETTGGEVPFYRMNGLCYSSDTVRIFVDSLFTLAPGSHDTICVDETHLLQVVPFGGNPEKYYTSWWVSDGRKWEEIPALANYLEAEITPQEAGEYFYRVIGRDSTFLYASGADDEWPTGEASSEPVVATSHADTAWFRVSVYDLDIRFGNLASDEIEIPVGARVELETEVYDGTGVYGFRWTPEDLVLSLDSLTGIIRTVALFRAEELNLTVMDTLSGCVRDRNVRIRIGKGEDIPNGFTPNGDGKNDIFLKGVAELTIYTRWGDEIFRTVSGEGWDGTYKGKTVKPGDYLYVAAIENEDGTRRIVKGVISVLLK